MPQRAALPPFLVLALTLTLVLVLTLALAPSGMISKKGVPTFFPSTVLLGFLFFIEISIDFLVIFRSIRGHFKVNFSILDLQIFNFSKSVRNRSENTPRPSQNHPQTIPNPSQNFRKFRQISTIFGSSSSTTATSSSSSSSSMSKKIKNIRKN